ncbi:MAG: hypothetical protein EOP56_00025 [Sphingobacteriales bacterium]|nr:MAG: hypothetical protein EOP56_00025 [Sphingobacteriales bacterium]
MINTILHFFSRNGSCYIHSRANTEIIHHYRACFLAAQHPRTVSAGARQEPHNSSYAAALQQHCNSVRTHHTSMNNILTD